MPEHRYILEPYKGLSTRYHCPSCKKRTKTFVRYIDTDTGQHVHNEVGRCGREIECGYHYKPKEYFQNNNISITQIKKPRPMTKPKPTSFIPEEIFFKSLQINKSVTEIAATNHFVKFLLKLFGQETTKRLIDKYAIGTSRHWNGATVFWQIDSDSKIRAGKIMLYNPTTGKRIKTPFNHITWVHTVLKDADFVMKQCFFGEHLLKNQTKTIAIVESEKTAIIASVYLPDYEWIACGQLNGLNQEKCEVLKGHQVILFPDLKAFDKWKAKADELSHITAFSVSEMLEEKATVPERANGCDIADFLIKKS